MINGDCLKTPFPENIKLIITSPPYAIGKDYDESIDLSAIIDKMCSSIGESGVICWQVGNRIEKGYITPIDILTHGDFIRNGFKLINRVVWHYQHGLHCTKRLSPRYEVVMIYVKGSYTFNLDSIRVPQKFPNKRHYKGPNKGQLSGNPLGKNPADVWEITNIKNDHPEKTAHPCQFPEALVERLMKAFSNEGDLILDPFMGSGTVGAVAKRLNRQFYGIELDARWYEIALKRIKGLKS